MYQQWALQWSWAGLGTMLLQPRGVFTLPLACLFREAGLFRSSVWSQTTWIWILTPPLSCSVILGKLPNRLCFSFHSYLKKKKKKEERNRDNCIYVAVFNYSPQILQHPFHWEVGSVSLPWISVGFWLLLLLKASLCARHTGRLNHTKRRRLEHRMVYFRATGGKGWLMPLEASSSPKAFSKDLL